MRSLIASLALCAAHVGAQNPASTILGKPLGRSADGFTEIIAARELPDGRVLAADMRENRLVLIDYRANSVRDVARMGPGPQEMTGAYSAFSWLGDTTLVYGRRDFLKVAPSGLTANKISVTVPMMGGGFGPAYGADRDGRLYFEVTPPLARGADGQFVAPVDASVIRWDPRNDRVDTVARLQHRDPKQPMYKYWRPFPRKDGIGVLPDGGVMIIRAQTYQAEIWRDGKVTVKGPVQNVPAITVNGVERDAFRDDRASHPAGGGSPNGAPIQISKLSDADREARRKSLELPDQAFPAAMSPIVEFRSTVPDLAGNIWVARSFASSAAEHVYDVFDGRGQIVRRVVVPNRGRVLGFGKGIVLVAVRDEDDVEWIEKYALN